MSISSNRGQRRHVVLSGGHIPMELKIRAKIKPGLHQAKGSRDVSPAPKMASQPVGESSFVIPSGVEESLAVHVFKTRDVSTSLDMTHRAESFPFTNCVSSVSIRP
jgi:hypothetical protein